MPRRTNHEGTFRRRGNSGQVGVQIAGHRHWASAPTRGSRPVKWCKSAPPSQFSQLAAAGTSITSFRSGSSPVVTSSAATPTLR